MIGGVADSLTKHHTDVSAQGKIVPLNSKCRAAYRWKALLKGYSQSHLSLGCFLRPEKPFSTPLRGVFRVEPLCSPYDCPERVMDVVLRGK